MSENVEAVRIQLEDFSQDEEIRALKASSLRMGGIATFLGCARDFSEGREVSEISFDAYDRMALPNLLLDPYFKDIIERTQQNWRQIVSGAVLSGIPTPAFSASLAYFDSYRSARLPANLLQAQRDYFGAHTYERVDQPRGKFFHYDWVGDKQQHEA